MNKIIHKPIARPIAIIIFSLSLITNLFFIAGDQISSVVHELTLSPGERQLRATADALEKATGFHIEALWETVFAGPGAPENTMIRYSMDYNKPDRLLISIPLPKVNNAGQIKVFHYRSLTIGDRYYINRIDEDGADWNAWDSPLGAGLDLQSIRLLPLFFRAASIEKWNPNVIFRLRQVIEIVGRGPARLYPGAIYYDYLEGTDPIIPFSLYVDQATGLPIRFETRPRQLPVEPGQDLHHHFIFDFTAYGTQTMPEPSPLVSPPPPGCIGSGCPGVSPPPSFEPGPTPGASGNLPDTTPAPGATPLH